MVAGRGGTTKKSACVLIIYRVDTVEQHCVFCDIMWPLL